MLLFCCICMRRKDVEESERTTTEHFLGAKEAGCKWKQSFYLTEVGPGRKNFKTEQIDM